MAVCKSDARKPNEYGDLQRLRLKIAVWCGFPTHALSGCDRGDGRENEASIAPLRHQKAKLPADIAVAQSRFFNSTRLRDT